MVCDGNLCRYGTLTFALGEIVFVTIAGQPMIFLNTLETATDLLLERSSIYSDRPVFPLVSL